MSSVDPRRSLELLRPTVDGLNADITALTPEQWEQPSSCHGWQVADLVAHVTRNGWSMLEYVRRNLSGDPSPPFGPGVNHVQEEIKASGARRAAERQARETDEFIALCSSLTDEQLAAASSGHSSGPHPLAWACTQRLLEVAYHHWDLRASFGDTGPLDQALASWLLAFVFDPAGRPAMALPSPGTNSPRDTFRLRSLTDGTAWRVAAGPDGLHVEAGPDGPAAAELAAHAGWLALAIYGRADIHQPDFQWSGSAEAMSRFAAVFGD